MAKVTPEMVSDFIRLHRQGWNFTAIGKKYGVDPRTVNTRTARAETEQERIQWESISRQVGVSYLEEHYRLVVFAGVGVLQSVSRDPLERRPDQDADQVLRQGVALGSEGKALLERRGVEIDNIRASGSQPTRPDPSRLARRMIEALVEHEPELRTLLDKWARHFRDFQGRRHELAEQARWLLINSSVDEGFAGVLGMPLAQEALEVNLSNKSLGKFAIRDLEDAEAQIVFEHAGQNELLLSGSKQKLHDLLYACDGLRDQVSHRERIDPVESVYRRLLDDISEIEDWIERLVLRGRPNGWCALCPNGMSGGFAGRER